MMMMTKRTEITFEKYVNCSKEVTSSKLCTIEELIEDIHTKPDSSQDDDEGEEVVPLSFEKAATYLENVRTFFV